MEHVQQPFRPSAILESEPQPSLDSRRPSQLAREVSVSDLLRLFARSRLLIARSVIASTVLAAGVAFVLPKKYTAEAVILTPQQSQPSLSAVAQLTGLSASAGLSSLELLSGLGMRSMSDLYVGILDTRTIADSIIRKFNLKEVYGVPDFYAARKRLKRNTAIKTGRDTLIHVQVEDKDPHRAADIANAYVDELADQNSRVAFTEASQRRVFYEGQLAKEKDALADAEVALKRTQESTGLVVPGGQADGLIRAASQLHAEILGREAQVQAMETYAAETNPRLQMARREVSVLRSELNKLESGNHVPGTPEVPAAQLPEAGLQYLRKYRDFKYHETLFEILAKQYEAARLDEAKSAPLVQVIDRAIPPERKSWPPRALIILLATTLSFLISGFWLIYRERDRIGCAQ